VRVPINGDMTARNLSDILLKIDDEEFSTFEVKISLPHPLGHVVSNVTGLTSKIYPDMHNVQEQLME